MTVNYLTLKDIKQQLVIEEDYTQDDQYLEALGDTCEELVEQQINKKLTDVLEENNNVLPAPLKHAIKLIIEYFYDNRGSGDNSIPDSFYYICALYRNYK